MDEAGVLIQNIDFSGMDIKDAVALAAMVRDQWCLSEAHKLPAGENHQLRVHGCVRDFQTLLEEVEDPEYCEWAAPKVLSVDPDHENTTEEALFLQEMADSCRRQIVQLEKDAEEAKTVLINAGIMEFDDGLLAELARGFQMTQEALDKYRSLLVDLQQEVDRTIFGTKDQAEKKQ